MGVQIGCAGRREQGFDGGRGVLVLAKFGAHHHPVAIEGAQGDCPAGKTGGQHVRRQACFYGVHAHIDSVARAIRAVRRLMLEINQQQLVAGFGVLEANAAWKARLCIGYDAHGAPHGERLMLQIEQWGENVGGQGDDLETHGMAPLAAMILHADAALHPILALGVEAVLAIALSPGPRRP
jgi:hypothetical protein